MKYVLKNCTNIEEWIVGKAISRREQDSTLSPFIYPYNLGRINNLKLVNINNVYKSNIMPLFNYTVFTLMY